MRLYDKITKEVNQSPEGPQIGAFFDFDGTIIYGYSATTYLREQVLRGDVKPRHLVELVATMTNFGLGNMAFSAMMSATSKYLKGVEEKDYIEFGEELYFRHIAKQIYPESRALIEAHLKKGHTVALISAATPYQVAAAAKDLGIPHVMCTHLQTRDGRFTGEVVKPTCFGMGKVAAAQGLIEQHGIETKQSFFYSDSDDDIQLLEYVGKPRPLNPNSRLRTIARGRGWPVQDFNSRGKVGVRGYLRTFAAQGSMVGAFLAGLPIYGLTGSMQKTRNFATSLFADLATAITGIELNITGEEHVWARRPCVFIFNHQSQADTIIVPALLRRDLAGVGKKEIGNIPILGQIMKFGGTVLIDRENTGSAKEAMKPLIDVMRLEGRSVCIAPEGTRSTSTSLGRFKKGAFHLAMQAQVPIVPIVIHNAIDVAPRGQFVMRPATVKITVLPPVDTRSWSVDTIDQHVDSVRDLYLIELDQMVLQRPLAKAKPKPKREQQTSATNPRPELEVVKTIVNAAAARSDTAEPKARAKSSQVKSSQVKPSQVKPSQGGTASGAKFSGRRSRKKPVIKVSAKHVDVEPGKVPETKTSKTRPTAKPVIARKATAVKKAGKKTASDLSADDAAKISKKKLGNKKVRRKVTTKPLKQSAKAG